MAKRKHLALRATYALAHLATTASALGLPGLVGPAASIAFDAAQSEITAAPSQDVAELRFQKRADFRCASSCASEAVTRSTDCRVDDYACGCKAENRSKIGAGVALCILGACPNEYVAASSALGSFCYTYDATATGAPPAPTTVGSTVVVVTNTGSNGTPSVSTMTIGLVATAPAAGGQASGSGGGLSGGAIAGIAVGATVIGCALIAVAACFGYRYRKMQKKLKTAGGDGAVGENAPATGPAGAGAGGGVAGAVPSQPELGVHEAKPGLHASTVSSSPTNVSSHPGFTPSPMTAVAHAVSPSTSPPPGYSGSWQQPQQPHPAHAVGETGGPPHRAYEVPGGREAPNPSAQEVHGASAAMEMTGDTRLPHEMAGRERVVYEMPVYTR